jgi:primosomal protein N' (replication factor Y)
MKPPDGNGSTGHLWIEEGDEHVGMVAEVAPVIPVDKTYSFAVLESMEAHLAAGQRVTVPVGKRGRCVQAFVVKIDRRPWDSTLRSIESLVDQESYLTKELIELGQLISRYYCCPLGRTLKAMTPEAVRQQRGLRTVRCAKLSKRLEQIRTSAERLSTKRERLLERLEAAGEPLEVQSLLSDVDASESVLRAVVSAGWVEIVTRKEVPEEGPSSVPRVEPAFELNADQQSALDRITSAIDANEFSTTLLYGVSGSGKTEIYIRAMQRVVADGRQAILLVPEIVLTTQLVQRLSSRFERVAVSHSGLTDAQRSVIWRQVASGEKQVVIGTRSAVFAPCRDLGLICVDEEQESSYKNLQAPRFHVRDVAIMRAHRLGIPVVLGSATASVETWYNCTHRPEFRLAVLPKRVKDLPLPKVTIVDMREEYRRQRRQVLLSHLMVRQLGETLERAEQAVLLLNRRGFASRVYCPACGTLLRCPNCTAFLVVHTARGESACHHCHTRIPTPSVCPVMGCGSRLVHLKSGTQRVEDVVSQVFPEASVRRVDSDTMRHRAHYQQVISDFESRKIGILVGTQMIAKGLDFPYVTFVGVVDADVGAGAVDFRAQESLFQLMTQVAGRAGRADSPGRVVVQTMAPDMPGLRFAVKHDYESFVRAELAARKRAGLPPYRRITRLVLMRDREETVRQEGQAIAQWLRAFISARAHQHTEVWGPHPCPLARLRGRYRYDVLLLSPSPSIMQEVLSQMRGASELGRILRRITIDVDPVSMN